MWYSSKISTVENRCKPVFMTLKISTATNYLPCCCTPRVLAASTCFLLFCIISMPLVHMHAIILWMCPCEFRELASCFYWVHASSTCSAENNNSATNEHPKLKAIWVLFFLRQNELSFKQKVCFTCFLPKFCMRHLLNGLATHFLLSSPLPFSQALLTSVVRGVTSGMKVQNDPC